MTFKTPVYMDYHATTPVDPRVLEAMLPYFTSEFGNASSTDHVYGSKASQAIEKAREQIAQLVNAAPEEIIFTSGATESDNLALQGVASNYGQKKRHVITCTTEHKAILNTCDYLASRGFSITKITVDNRGVVDLEKLDGAITDETMLITVMFANNEVGTIAPMEEIGNLARKHDVLFHSDAAQATGHIPVDVKKLNLDLMSISSHKTYGPKGVGALYVRRHGRRVRPAPMILGGGQERGLRSGTENVSGIVGMGEAMEIARKEMAPESKRLSQWTSNMRSIFTELGETEQNGHPTQKLPGNLNMYFQGVESKALIQSLRQDVAISAGSACTTKEVEPSHVLIALGYPPERAYSSVRFGLGRFNTEEEVEYATEAVQRSVKRLRKIVAV